MAQTDTRPGFRLPWSSDRSETDAETVTTEAETASTDASTDAPLAESVEVAAETAAGDPTSGTNESAIVASVEADPLTGAPETVTAADAPSAHPTETAPPAGADVWAASAPAVTIEVPTKIDVPAPAPARKPTKFLADLTKAMLATAKAARSETLERLGTDAKTATERVHTLAAEEAADLRRLADEDIAAVRDWSKAEIARIREATEGRISGRKSELERELGVHAGTIDARIERVTAFVTAYESEVAAFYDRLFAEEDPTRFAAMAADLPEAPNLELAVSDAAAAVAQPVVADAETEPAEAAEAAIEDVSEMVAEPVADSAPEAVAETGVETVAETGVETVAETGVEVVTETGVETVAETGVEVVTETGVETVAETGVEVVTETGVETVAETGVEVVTEPEAVLETTEAEAVESTATEGLDNEAETGSIDPSDPRLEALAGVSDFAAAEAEAAVGADDPEIADGTEARSDADDIPVIADDVLAARINGLVPDETNNPNPLITSKVIVGGLVSVASIAGFKRHLSRLNGVTTVGVSSGPDGEFVFSVHHLPTVDLAAGITSLPGFDTRITGQEDGTVTVTARDPESHD